MLRTGTIFKGNIKCQDGFCSLLCALMAAVIIPVYHWYLPPVIILWIIVRSIEIKTTGILIASVQKDRITLFGLFVLFFAWQIIGLLYSNNLEAGLRNIGLRLSLILIPLLLIYPGEYLRRNVKLLLRAFAISNFSFLVFCFCFALARSLTLQDGSIVFNPHPADANWLNNFYAMKLSIYQHPSYLALFTLLSTFIAFDAGFVNDISRKAKAAWITAGVMLLISVFFLSSRAAILAAIVSMPLYFFRLSRRGTATKTILAGSLVFILLAVSLAVTNPRVSSTIRSVAGSQTGNTSLPEGRLLIWSAVTEIITENMVLGVGTGDLQDELNKRYVEIGKTDFARDNFNTHNQFIEILAENGIIGLSIFLLIFLNLLYISVREWNLILVMFIIIVFISFMFETMLNRLAGVSFFAYFSLILPNSGNSAGSNP